MTTTLITYAETVEALGNVVKGKEKFIYDATDGCVYSKKGAPSCGVGHVLAALTPDLYAAAVTMEQAEGLSFPMSHLNDGKYMIDYWDKGTMFTSRAENLLESFQTGQDEGQTWGDSLVEAINDSMYLYEDGTEIEVADEGDLL